MRKHREKETIVYVAINQVNRRKYIGVTTRTLRTRARGHFYSAKNKVHGGSFLKAINKYGINAFAFYTLAKFTNYAAAAAEEIRLIALIKPEYNSTSGGDGTANHKKSPEAIEKYKQQAFKNIEKWKEYSVLGPKSMARKVVCLDDGSIFESASAAARHYKVARSALIELCLGQRHRKAVGGKRFQYVEERKI